MIEYRATSIVTGNLKGGVGKSTVTSLLAAVYAKHFNQKVLVVDTDLQNTIYLQRMNELQEAEDKKGVGVFDVLSLDPNQLFDVIEMEEMSIVSDNDYSKMIDLSSDLRMEFHTEAGFGQIKEQKLYHYQSGYLLDNYDLVFFDIPGTLSDGSELKKAYVLADIVITPLAPSIKDLGATKMFVSFLEEVRRLRLASDLGMSSLLFINTYNNTSECSLMKTALEQTLPQWVNILDEYLYNRNTFRNYCSTTNDPFYSKDEKVKNEKIEVTKLADRVYQEIEQVRKSELELIENDNEN